MKGKPAKYIIGSLMGALAAVFIWRTFLTTEAVFEESGVHIDPAAEEDSMLIIGTHLIHLHALTDELYQIAETSASNANQRNRYYKSELADGRWMDITDAASLSDLMETGIMADNEEIGALFLTHRTGADGITYDLRTGQAVSVFAIRPLYEIDALPELEPLKLQYDLLSRSDPDREMKRNLDRIRRFFEDTNVKDGEAQQYDEQLEALQSYYMILCENGAPQEEKDTVQEIMGKVDCSRRAVVYERLSAALQEMSDEMSGGKNTEGEEEETSEPLRLDQALLTAMQDSGRNLMDSLNQARGNELAVGDTVMDNVRYRLAMALVSHAQAGDHSACDEEVQNLILLGHIMESEICDAAGELAFLESELIPPGDAAYASALSPGISQRYQEALEEKASHVVLEHIMAEDTAAYETARNELQFYIQAAVDRMEDKEAQEYIRERIRQAASFLDAVPGDAYEQAAQASTDSYLLWLQMLLSRMTAGAEEIPINRMYEEKASLQEERLEALDDLDLDRAKRLEARIEAKEAEIRKAARAQADGLNRLYEEKAALEALQDSGGAEVRSRIAALDGQIAIASAQLTDGSEAANIERLKSDAQKALRSSGAQHLSELEASVDGLIASLGGGFSLAGNALKDVYKDMAQAGFLSGQNEYDEIMEKIEEAVAVCSEVTYPPEEALTPEQAVSVLEEALGGSLENENGPDAAGVSPKEKTAAVIALAACGDAWGSEALTESAGALAASLAGREGIWLYEEKNGLVNSQALAACKGYRYVWHDTGKTVILSKGSVYYQFTAFQKQVFRNGGSTEEMEAAAGYAGVLYLPPEYVYEQFGCRACVIPGTGYAVLADEEVTAASEELTALLMDYGTQSSP